MTAINIPQLISGDLQPARWARNDRYPTPYFQAQIVAAANQAARWRSRQVARFVSPLDGIPASGGTGRGRWRWAWRSGPRARYLWTRAVLAQVHATGTVAPHGLVTITDALGTLVGASEHYYGPISASPVDAPSELGVLDRQLADGGAPIAIAPNTEYRGLATDEDSRLVALAVYELSAESDDGNGYLLDKAVSLGPVYDSDRGGPAQLLREMWNGGGAQLATWSVNRQAAPRTRTSATPINLIDNTTTAISATAPGLALDGRYRSTIRRAGQVPITMWVYASQSADQGVVKLVDSAGAEVCVVRVASPTARWASATKWIPATVDKYGLYYASNGSATLSVHAVSVAQLEP